MFPFYVSTDELICFKYTYLKKSLWLAKIAPEAVFKGEKKKREKKERETLPFWSAQMEYFNFTALALFFVLGYFRVDLEQIGALSSYCSPQLRGLVLFSYFF